MATVTKATLEGMNRAFNSKNADTMAKNFANDGSYQDPFLPGPVSGKEAVRQYLAAFYNSFPDFKVSARAMVVEGNYGVLINQAGGTFKRSMTTGEGKTLQPTNKKFTGEYAVVYDFNREGKVRSLIVYGDSLSIFKQLGLSL